VTTSPTHPDDDVDPIEELLAEALSIIEIEGLEHGGLQRFLDDHPTEAAELRKALEALDQMQLLEQRPDAIAEPFCEFVIQQRRQSPRSGE
tara:strand:- start:917 stop:1189 length:273 start_codon:yes stop_codon:yes gene_type:complete